MRSVKAGMGRQSAHSRWQWCRPAVLAQARTVSARIRAAAQGREAAQGIRDLRRALRISARTARWPPSHACVRAALGRSFGTPRATRHLEAFIRRAPAGSQAKWRAALLTPRLRKGLQGALAPSRSRRAGSLRPRTLRSARMPRFLLGAVHARVHQPAEDRTHQRLRSVDSAVR